MNRTPERRAGYLPIAPSDEHPDTGELLRLDSECPDMWKKSYINIKQIHDMYASIFKECSTEHSLDQVSYLKVAHACGYRPTTGASLKHFIKHEAAGNSGKGKKSLKGVDTRKAMAGQGKKPVQDAHPDPPLGDTVDDRQGQAEAGDETKDKVPATALEEVGVENLVSPPIEGSPGRTDDGVSAALLMVDNIPDKGVDVPTAVTLHTDGDGPVGACHSQFDVSSSAVSFSSGASPSISSSDGSDASDAEENTPSNFPTTADVPAPDKDSSSVKKGTTTTALVSTDKKTTSENTVSSDEESSSSSSSETGWSTSSIVSSTTSVSSGGGQLLNSTELSGDIRTPFGVVSCAALLACVCVLAWVYWGFPGA